MTMQYRTLALVPREEGNLSGTLSTEAIVERSFGRERLVHEKQAIDFSRCPNGTLPLFYSHGHVRGEKPVGRIEGIRLDNETRSLKFANIVFAPTEEGKQSELLVRGGFMPDISIGYKVREHDDSGDEWRATRWTPFEGSVTALPQDIDSGIGRSEDAVMDKSVDKPVEKPSTAERNRTREITEIGQLCGRSADDILAWVSDDSLSPDQLRSQLLAEAREKDAKPVTEHYKPGHDQQTNNPHDNFYRGVVDSVMERSCMLDNVPTPNEHTGPTLQRQWDGMRDERDALRKRMAGNEYRGLSLTDIARDCLKANGQSDRGNPDAIIGRAIEYFGEPSGDWMDGFLGRSVDGPLGQVTTDFTNILADLINKSLLNGWMQARETWMEYANVDSARDFKPGSRTNLSNFSDLALVPENTDYTEGTVVDFGEPFQVATYGKLWSVSRQALVNDDLSALTRAPTAMGLAAARVPGDLCYAALINNRGNNMSDGNPLYDSLNHGNTKVSGAPPSVAEVNAIQVAMGTQTDANNVTLGLHPDFLICPLELANTSRVLRAAQYDPDATAGTLTPNAVGGTFQVVADHRLSTDSAVKWYMAGGLDRVEVTFLNGQQSPSLESDRNWKRDGTHWKVRLDVTAFAREWRGLYLNPGA